MPTLFRSLFGSLLFVALAGCTPPAPTYKGTDVTGIDWGGDITLQAHTGKTASTEDFRGKILILFFGYTHCPDICGPTLARLAGLRQSLKADAAQVQVIFITVDPAHDDVEQLAQFVPQFDPTFVGLTGKPEELAAAAREYKVTTVAAGAAASQMQHTGSMFVKDKTGKLRLLWKNDMSVADMEHDLRLLLRSAG